MVMMQLHYAKGDVARAIEVGRTSLADEEAALGEDHPALSSALTNLAKVLSAHGEAEEALQLRRRAAALKAATYPPDHPENARAQLHLALSLAQLERDAEASEALRRAIPVLEASAGRDTSDLDTARGLLAQLDGATTAAPPD